jgi:hypothetical protein
MLQERKDMSETAKTPEMEWITKQEASHFTCNRVMYTLISFATLYVTQAMTGPSMKGKLSELQVYAIYSGFTMICLALTIYAIKLVSWI